MKSEVILWGEAEMAASGWSDVELSQAKQDAVLRFGRQFIGEIIELHDKVASYSYHYRDNPKGFKGIVHKVYQIDTVEDFVNAFEDSRDSFIDFMRRAGHPRVVLTRPTR